MGKPFIANHQLSLKSRKGRGAELVNPRLTFRGARAKPNPNEINSSSKQISTVTLEKLNAHMQKKQPKASFQIKVKPSQLVLAKKSALRKGMWYRILNKIERSTIDLTIRYVDNIKSTKLAKLVTAIMEKLETKIENQLERLVRTVGLTLTQKMSKIAIGWGNKTAHLWANDPSYAKYLVLITNSIGAN